MRSFLEFTDDRLCQLSPWCAAIYHAHRSGPDGMVRLLQKQWISVSGKGVRSFCDEILRRAIPLQVVLEDDVPLLHVKIRHERINYHNRMGDATFDAFLAAPSNEHQIRELLASKGLDGIPELTEFYTYFNHFGEFNEPDTFDVSSIRDLRYLYKAVPPDSSPLPKFPGRLWKEASRGDFHDEIESASSSDPKVLASKALRGEFPREMDSAPCRTINPADWYILSRFQWDTVLLHPDDRVAWLLSSTSVWTLEMTFSQFLQAHAKIWPRDGEDFLFELAEP